MNTPRTYINLRVNPNNEAEVLGQYVGTDGEVSEQLYLVATMSGNPTGRRHAAKQFAASEQLVEACEAALANLTPVYSSNHHVLALLNRALQAIK